MTNFELGLQLQDWWRLNEDLIAFAARVRALFTKPNSAASIELVDVRAQIDRTAAVVTAYGAVFSAVADRQEYLASAVLDWRDFEGEIRLLKNLRDRERDLVSVLAKEKVADNAQSGNNPSD